MPNHTVLVTGGAGFIGANLILTLLQEGYRIRVLDRNSDDSEAPGFLHTHPRVEWWKGDVLNAEDVERAVAGAKHVIHLAAETSVIESVEHPEDHVTANLQGVLHVLEAARQAHVKSVVFASSNAAVGEAGGVVHENLLQKPLSPYGASKLAGEALCHAYAQSYGLGAVALRFSNVYGPFSRRKGSVVAEFLRRIETGRPILVYGDGEQSRDFIHAEDLARAVVAAAEKGRPGEVYQIATGVETSVNRLLSELEAASGSPIAREYRPRRSGEIQKNVSCIEKARTELDWNPQITLPEGLRSTWEWWFHSSQYIARLQADLQNT